MKVSYNQQLFFLCSFQRDWLHPKIDRIQRLSVTLPWAINNSRSIKPKDRIFQTALFVTYYLFQTEKEVHSVLSRMLYSTRKTVITLYTIMTDDLLRDPVGGQATNYTGGHVSTTVFGRRVAVH